MAKGKYHEWRTKRGLTLLKGWAMEGLTDEQIAHNMGITMSTYYDYKLKFADISEALAQGKQVVDFAVENALQKRAEGYDVWEEEEVWSAELGEWVPVRRRKKHIAADVTAASMWLRNRKADKWRDKPELVGNDEIEDDGLMAALSSNTDDLEDDSFLIEGENE